MTRYDESAADHRKTLSRARIAAQWRSRMRQWSAFRRQAWKIDRQITEHWFAAHIEVVKGEGEWTPLSNAPPQIDLVDSCVAELLGCVVSQNEKDLGQEPPRFSWWNLQYDPDPDDQPYPDVYYEDNDWEEDRRLEEKINSSRERAGDLLLLHYLLPHVRLYRKLKLLGISERTYYYRLNSALDELADAYLPREIQLKNVQS